MKNIVLTALIAVVIGLAPLGARPAHALSEKELLALLAGAAAIAIINNEIKDKRTAAPQYGRHTQDARHGKYGDRSRVLPAECIRRIEGPGWRDREVLGARCLERNDVRLKRLPRECRISVRTDRGSRDAYATRCVERAGWVIEDMRRWRR